MNNRQREILALRYLSALQNRDLATLADILVQAETDDVLEVMIREIHVEDQTVWQAMHATSNGRGKLPPRLDTISIGSQPKPDKEYSDMTTTTLAMPKPRIAVPWTMVAAAATILMVGALLLFSSANFEPSVEPTGFMGPGAPTDPGNPAQLAATEEIKTPIAAGLGDHYTQESTLTIPIETELVNLDVQSEISDVRIEAADGPIDAITVAITRHVQASDEAEAEAFMAAQVITAERDGNMYRVVVTNERDEWKYPGIRVDLVITVPQTVNVSSESEIGSVVVTGITAPDYVSVEAVLGSVKLDDVTAQGDLMIEADLGDVSLSKIAAEADLTVIVETGQIVLNDVTNTAHTRLEVQAGDIQVQGLGGGGSLTVDAQLGAIKIIDAEHVGQAAIQAELGDLHFDGIIAGDGTYDFAVGVGNIEIIAQPGSAFEFEAEVDTGHITSNLAGGEVTYDLALIGMSAQGALQPDSDSVSATVTVTCDMGNILIQD